MDVVKLQTISGNDVSFNLSMNNVNDLNSGLIRIQNYLEAQRSEFFALLQDGLTLSEIRKLENTFHLVLPTEVIELYRWRNGAKTYQFTVGNNAGAFNAVVDLPAYVSTDSAKVVSYKVAPSTAEVSNAEILKSIVALIAAINKQITALQKLILSRK